MADLYLAPCRFALGYTRGGGGTMGQGLQAVERIDGSGKILLTCEHASVEVPAPWAWPEADRWLVGTHWSYDLGAADLTRELAREAGWGAVLSRFSRLLVDPNRALEEDTLFRSVADGKIVHLNAGLSDRERQRRIQMLWEPYHRAVDQAVAESTAQVVCGMHSFTPVYEGQRREMEIGVLFNDDEDYARAVAHVLLEAGYAVRLNEPWSGRDGLMFSAEHHARAHGRLAIEIEVRQDLALQPEWNESFAPILHRALVRALR
jgi:predicted N-formylglutamate amidohydrolase